MFMAFCLRLTDEQPRAAEYYFIFLSADGMPTYSPQFSNGLQSEQGRTMDRFLMQWLQGSCAASYTD